MTTKRWGKIMMSPHGSHRWGSDNLEVAQMKKCNRCKEPKALDQFYKLSASRDGLQPRCKACHTTLKRDHYLVNSEKVLATKRDYYFANRVELRVASRERYRANSDERCIYNRGWASANRVKVRTSNQEYSKSNPKKMRLKCLRRRANTRANGVYTVTVKELQRLLGRPCYLCETAPSKTIDHITPISRGGRHSIGNFLGACGSCNSSKNNKLLVEYRRFQRIINQARVLL